MNNNNDLNGLRGWLILVGMSVVIGPFRLAYEVGPLYYSIFTDGTFEILTTPGLESYHHLWGPLLAFEAVYNSFSKHYLFPKIYIAIVLLSLLFIPLDAWIASFIITDEPMFDPATTKEFARTLFSAVIWVPYMLVSKRVKATFVENMPNTYMTKPVKEP